MNLSELQEVVAALGEHKYRAGQIFDWLHKKFLTDFAKAENLPLSLREKLKAYPLYNAEIIKRVESKDGTVKSLHKLHDGLSVESVLMNYKHGKSICISTQAGCRMGCKFCASGATGLERNLRPSEMLMALQTAVAFGESLHGASLHEEVALRAVNKEHPESSPRLINNIVLMGCGEPLDNYDNVLRFIELISDPAGFGLGKRHITLSTCGLIPEIYRLTAEQKQINLAISLHAPNDKIREKLMLITKAYPLKDLLRACSFYTKQTSRRITFEYAMIHKINDTAANARELSALLKGMLCHVNLIPVNDGYGSFIKSKPADIKTFARILQNNRIPVTIRRSLGADIQAACGQLRNNGSEEKIL